MILTRVTMTISQIVVVGTPPERKQNFLLSLVLSSFMCSFFPSIFLSFLFFFCCAGAVVQQNEKGSISSIDISG